MCPHEEMGQSSHAKPPAAMPEAATVRPICSTADIGHSWSPAPCAETPRHEGGPARKPESLLEIFTRKTSCFTTPRAPDAGQHPLTTPTQPAVVMHQELPPRAKRARAPPTGSPGLAAGAPRRPHHTKSGNRSAHIPFPSHRTPLIHPPVAFCSYSGPGGHLRPPRPVARAARAARPDRNPP